MAVKDANTDKLKKDLISQFNKQFPESPLEQMNESNLAEVPGWMTTGNYALNWIISKDMYKGLPMGRVILFTGDPGSGKSMIALSMMRDEAIDLIVYMDSEGGGVTEDFAEFLGIDTSKILYTPIDTIEDLIDRMEKVIDTIEKNKSSKNILMVIDSISMLTTNREKDPNGGCYTPKTIVNTLKNDKIISKIIKDIKVGDKVLTHLNTWEEVTNTISHSSDEKPNLVEIETEEGIITLTPNHRLLVDRDGLQWIEAGELKETDLLQKIF